MPAINPHRLQDLIGKRLQYRGSYCQIIDILDEGPALILQDCSDHKTIQANQFGEANRRVSPTFVISLLNVRGDGLNPVLSQLGQSYSLASLLRK